MKTPHFNTSSPLVLFDLNGTLMDDLDRAVRATNAVLAKHTQMRVDQDSFRESFTLPLDTWLASFGIPAHLLHQAEEHWGAEMRKPSPLRRGAREMFLYLRERGVTTGVISAVSPSAVSYTHLTLPTTPYV